MPFFFKTAFTKSVFQTLVSYWAGNSTVGCSVLLYGDGTALYMIFQLVTLMSSAHAVACVLYTIGLDRIN